MTMRRDAGFTLLEILVAIVVLGFIVIGLTQAVQFGFKAWQTQTKLLSGRGDLDAVDRALRRLVAQIDPGDAVEHPRFVGGAGRLEFVSELPAAAGPLASTRADVALLVSPSHQLLLLWAPSRHAETLGPLPPAQSMPLLDHVERLELAYWRPLAAGGGWQRSWALPFLPTLVRIRIVFPAGDARRWPDIVVGPMREALEQ